jgi:hypothetical protein
LLLIAPLKPGFIAARDRMAGGFGPFACNKPDAGYWN